MLRICIDNNDWGGAHLADVEAVVCNTGEHLLRHLSTPLPSGDVMVQCRPNEANPRILYRTRATDPHYIWLTTQGRLWCKIAYQFAHELCHLISDHDRLRDSGHKWLHESLCELASIFAVSKMAESWGTHPPYPHWASYSAALREYANELLSRPSRQLPNDEPFRIWFGQHASALAVDPYQRELNGVVALALFPIFMSRPEYWELVRWMPNSQESFPEFLSKWHEHSPAALAGGVKTISAIFGCSI